ncbi:MAG: WbqC family protein [Desulfobulbaceae bacterium]|nr:WbqC family protein [Desulfobulbaceae bacterium]
MIISVHQPQYMPWLGYFAKMAGADHFILLDTVQYKKNEWQNRNRIKTATGWQWLTVPVAFNFPETINQVRTINSQNWQRTHQQSIITNYNRAPYFEQVMTWLAPLFAIEWKTLAELNISLVRSLAGFLGITTLIHVASELGPFPETPDERLIVLVRHFDGKKYIAGSGGQGYMNLNTWSDAGIEVEFQDYHHPTYPQLFGPFEPNLSVLDLLFNCGPNSLNLLRNTS